MILLKLTATLTGTKDGQILKSLIPIVYKKNVSVSSLLIVYEM
jgi:hypothetical protein